MAVTYSSFIIRFPEFTTSDPDEQTRITQFISDATRECNSDSWGDKQDTGVSYLTAHMLAMANRARSSGSSGSSGSGPVEEAQAGKLRVRYGNPSEGTNSPFLYGLDSTPYGLVYSQLLATLSITPVIA